ncbi:MAG: ABC transporter permease [Pseudomonadaceae bacterium]|nr:ABC transporter permease [Pseudomonadaceae bacterium]
MMNAIHLDAMLQSPGLLAWLGTDELGRDVLARLLAGLGVSLSVGLTVGLATAAIGISLGLLAGWRGGWVDMLVNRACDVVLSLPGLLLAMALTALLGPSLVNVMLALSLLGWVGFCRLTRAEVLRVRGRPFVAAATLAGVPPPVLVLRHILPHCVAPLMVEAVVVVAGSMVAEAGLSFLGLGVPPPMPSLGGMLREGIRYAMVAPHLVLAPAVVLIGLTIALNMVAEGLRRRA